MTAPVDTKTVRVSPEVHEKIMDIAARLRGTADEALRELLAGTTVHVPLTPVQCRRWRAAAAEVGVSLEQLIKLRVEAAIQGGDSRLIERTYYTVRAIAAHHGVTAAHGVQLTTDDPAPSPPESEQQ